MLNMEYNILHFDREGLLDTSERLKYKRLALDCLPFPNLFEESSEKIIEARHKFALKRFKHECTWTPTPEIESAIIEAIFKK